MKRYKTIPNVSDFALSSSHDLVVFSSGNLAIYKDPMLSTSMVRTTNKYQSFGVFGNLLCASLLEGDGTGFFNLSTGKNWSLNNFLFPSEAQTTGKYILIRLDNPERKMLYQLFTTEGDDLNKVYDLEGWVIGLVHTIVITSKTEGIFGYSIEKDSELWLLPKEKIDSLFSIERRYGNYRLGLQHYDNIVVLFSRRDPTLFAIDIRDGSVLFSAENCWFLGIDPSSGNLWCCDFNSKKIEKIPLVNIEDKQVVREFWPVSQVLDHSSFSIGREYAVALSTNNLAYFLSKENSRIIAEFEVESYSASPSRHKLFYDESNERVYTWKSRTNTLNIYVL